VKPPRYSAPHFGQINLRLPSGMPQLMHRG
jgi:hypothetical protein